MIRKKQKRCVRRLLCEQFEARLCLSAISFASHDIIATEANGAYAVHAADLDGDGDMDVLSASRLDGNIGWYENADGNGTFGPQRIIAISSFAQSVYATDLDGDGDMDVLSGGGGGTVAWYENVDGNGTFGEKQVIVGDSSHSASGYAADLDGDGDMDVVSASSFSARASGRSFDSIVAWYENLDGKGTFGGPHRIATEQGSEAKSVYAADLDGDDDLDVLSACSPRNGRFVWYENVDGKGTFGQQHIISRMPRWAESVYATELDGDGDLDILYTDGNNIAWYENRDGKGTFGQQHVITTNAAEALSVYAVDVDGDGDQDVVAASSSPGKIAWYENTDGAGSFGPEQVITTRAIGARAVYATDLDGDNDVDVLSASVWDDKIAWYQNTDGTGSFGQQELITGPTVGNALVFAADLDGDGDTDLLSASRDNNTIAWHANIDGRGTFAKRQVISSNADSWPGARWVYAADVDGDGDLDILFAHYFADLNSHVSNVAWYENVDGRGTFGPQQIITTVSANWDASTHTADVDSDGDLDILFANENNIAWYENRDGKGTFGSPRPITRENEGRISSLCEADVDGDGDADILSASYWDDAGTVDGRIVWYENTDGRATFGQSQPITRENKGRVSSLDAADFDGDGDVDVVSTSGGRDGVLAWYENIDGQGNFAQPHFITTQLAYSGFVHGADVDGDGDMDVVATRAFSSTIVWYQNSDGKGTFGSPQLIGTEVAFEPSSLCATDVDGDGDLDFVAATFSSPGFGGTDKVAWYEQYRAAAGDANRDREFNQKDILQVLQGCKYLTGEPATWEEGDWNEDGVFDQLDVAAALATGNYLQGPYAAGAADRVFAELAG